MTSVYRSGAVGIFDSGVGGLSVLVEIRRELPNEDVVYVADSAHAPYGEQPADRIRRRSALIVEFLEQQGAKAVVVACNTATSLAVDRLRERWSMPIVAIEPAIKPAAAMTRTGIVGVLATSGTIASDRFAALASRYAPDAEIVAQACPGLVRQVEHGELSTAATRALVEQYVAPLLRRGADTLVLGCTHYPFLTPVIRQVAGPSVAILNPAAAVAREVRRRLEDADLRSDAAGRGATTYWTSGSPEQLRRLLVRLGLGTADVAALPV